MAELNFVDEIEATVSKEIVLLFTDEPERAIKLRNELRIESPKSQVMIRDARFFKNENDIEHCNKMVFLCATNRDLIIATYRQAGERFKVADAPAGEFGEPVGLPVDSTPEDDTKLDLGDTLGNPGSGITGDNPDNVDFSQESSAAGIGSGNDSPIEGLAGIPGEIDPPLPPDYQSFTDDQLREEYNGIFGKNPHHLKSRDTIIRELTAWPEGEA